MEYKVWRHALPKAARPRAKFKSKLIFAGLFLLFFILVLALGRLIQVYAGNFYDGERDPYLQSMSSTSVVVRWQSEDNVSGRVRYGLAADQLDQFADEAHRREVHEVRLQGLMPATRYYYSVGDRHSVMRGGEDYWFVTAPEPGANTPVRFWVLGDPGNPGQPIESVREAAYEWLEQNPRIGRPSLDLMLSTGDNAYRSGTNKQFQKALFDVHKDTLRNVAYWPGYGNHDARRWAYFNIFTLPENGEAGGLPSGSEHYFAFDYANIHFVFLDTYTYGFDDDDDMLQWLKMDLQSTHQQWLIVVMHHPPYTRGSHNSDNPRDSKGRMINVREHILPILENAGVDLVFAGHTHMYERSYFIDCHYGLSDNLNENMIVDGSARPFKKQSAGLAPHQGTVVAVNGSSSAINDGPLDHPANQVALKELGSMIIDVDGLRLDARFINERAEVKDAFSIIKGAADAPAFTSTCAAN